MIFCKGEGGQNILKALYVLKKLFLLKKKKCRKNIPLRRKAKKHILTVIN